MIKKTWPIVLFLVFLCLPLNSWGQSSTSKTQKTITIQVASHNSVEAAEQELQHLKSLGIDSFVRHELVQDKGRWYRVYVGRFETRDEATNYAQEIKAQGLISAFWVKQIKIPVDPIISSQTRLGPTEKPETNIDTGHQEPATPAIVVEMPRTVMPPEEKSSFSQIPAEKPKIDMSEKAQEQPPTAEEEINKNVPPKTMKTITIQVISLKKEEKAEQELARLKSHGLNPFMRHERVRDKGMWYRIYVGQFDTKNDATKFAQSIKDQGIISLFWVKQIEMPYEPATPSPTPVDQVEQPELTVADPGPEKPAAPSIVTEIPEPAILPEEKPPITQTPPEMPVTLTPEKAQEPVPVPEKEVKKMLPPEELGEKEPVPAPKKEAKKMLPPEDLGEKEPISPDQGIAVQRPDKHSENGRISFGVRSSYFLASNTEDFIIERTAGSDRSAWSVENAEVYNALTSSYRLNSAFSIEAAIEKAFFTKLDIWHLNIGPKFEFSKINMLTPYARGGLVIGHLEWDEVPGDFDTALGWEGGFGIAVIKSNIQFGLEASYRAIKYDYNRPSNTEVTATDNQLDFSGYALSAILSYWF